jgi:hypothetical protein
MQKAEDGVCKWCNGYNGELLEDHLLACPYNPSNNKKPHTTPHWKWVDTVPDVKSGENQNERQYGNQNEIDAHVLYVIYK